MKLRQCVVIVLLAMLAVTSCSNKKVSENFDEEIMDEKISDSVDYIEQDLEYDWIGDNERFKQLKSGFTISDELYYKHKHNVEFVAVMLPAPDEYFQAAFEESGNQAYIQFYIVGEDDGCVWEHMGYEMLPCELKIGEFAYVKVDTTFHKGGESNVHSILFEDIKECKKNQQTRSRRTDRYF